MMKKKSSTLIIVSLLSLLFLFAVLGEVISVPAIPNESLIKGVVSEYAIVSSRLIGVKPEQVLYRLTVNIESSEKIGDNPGFLNDRNGEDIQFYSREKLPPELFNRRISARVKYKGDERSGLYWIRNIEILKENKKK